MLKKLAKIILREELKQLEDKIKNKEFITYPAIQDELTLLDNQITELKGQLKKSYITKSSIRTISKELSIITNRLRLIL